MLNYSIVTVSNWMNHQKHAPSAVNQLPCQQHDEFTLIFPQLLIMYPNILSI